MTDSMTSTLSYVHNCRFFQTIIKYSKLFLFAVNIFFVVSEGEGVYFWPTLYVGLFFVKYFHEFVYMQLLS